MFYRPCMQCLGSADQIRTCACDRVMEGGGEGAPQWANMLGTIDKYIYSTTVYGVSCTCTYLITSCSSCAKIILKQYIPCAFVYH